MKEDTIASFDVLLYLAENNPAAFEKYRSRVINKLIENAPEAYQRRLRGLQFQIDATRRASSTPLVACLKISRMMHDSADRLRQALDSLQSSKGRMSEHSASTYANSFTAQSATVVPFPQQV